MILTVTPHPSIDRTVALGSPLVRGAVHRLASVTDEPGGKGVNVARALTAAGVDAVALLPADRDDPLLAALDAAGVAHRAVAVGAAVRTNLTLTEPDGTTTKLNTRGAVVDAVTLAALTAAVTDTARAADWVVVSGSLPPGIPDRWYGHLVPALRAAGCRIAVDTSEGPLAELVASLPGGAPDLVKPNTEELATAVGSCAGAMEAAVARGDLAPVVAAARTLVDRGIGAVLATLGAAGAVLVTRSDSWWASTPPILVRSTVGAGDASLAGYLRAAVAGAPEPARLQLAVAYGSAAAALPGSAVPTPADIDLDGVAVSRLRTPSPPTAPLTTGQASS